MLKLIEGMCTSITLMQIIVTFSELSAVVKRLRKKSVLLFKKIFCYSHVAFALTFSFVSDNSTGTQLVVTANVP